MAKRKLIAAMVAALMMFSVVGCGGTSSENGGTQTGSTTAQTGTENVPTITQAVLCLSKPADTELVQEAINKITVEKIGAKIELLPIEIGNYAQQLSVLLSGGGGLDIYPAGGPGGSFTTFISNGQAMALDEYIAPYADSIKGALTEEVFNAGYSNGKYYGVPRYLDFASRATYVLRKDIADKYGFVNGSAITMNELTDIFKKIRADGDNTPLIGYGTQGLLVNETRVDNLGDFNFLGVLNNLGQSDKIVNYYTSDEYLDLVSYYKQWKELNAYMPDMLNATTTPADFISSGQCYGAFQTHFNAELCAQYSSQQWGTEMVAAYVLDTVAITPGMFFCVAPTAKNPDKAAAWLNLQATSADIENLLSNGIKDVHYTVNSEGVATYVSGKNMSNTGWGVGSGWANMNSLLTYPFEYPKDYFETMKKANDDAPKSKAFGAQFDVTEVANQVAACTNVVTQYKAAIETGSVSNFDKAVSDFQNALKDAGIDAVIAEKQSQLDQFLATKPK